MGLNAQSNEGILVIKKLEQDIVPAIYIIKLLRESNSVEIKFMLEGENLIHEEGQEYRLFL